MHQLFVTTAPMGLSSSGNFNFSRRKAQVNALHCGAIFVVRTLPKAPLKSQEVYVNILPGIQTWNQKSQ